MYVIRSIPRRETPPPVAHESGLDDPFALSPIERLPSGRTAFWEGDMAEHAFFIEQGMVRIQRDLLDGCRAVAGFVGPGDVIGLAPGGRYRYTAEAVTNSQLRRAPFSAFVPHASGDTSRATQRLASMQDAGAAVHEQLLVLLHQNADERLAGFLAMIAARFAGRMRRGLVLSLPMPRLDIADYLGLSVETVCRSMTRLRAEGIVLLPSPNLIVVQNPAALLERAGEPASGWNAVLEAAGASRRRLTPTRAHPDGPTGARR